MKAWQQQHKILIRIQFYRINSIRIQRDPELSKTICHLIKGLTLTMLANDPSQQIKSTQLGGVKAKAHSFKTQMRMI